MTREEKLQKAHRMFDNRNLLTELKWQREYFKSGYVNSQEELFNLWIFDECIKVLEQEPTTKNDLGVDAVRRKAVLNTLDNMDSALDNEDRTVETYKKLLKECYKVLPSVTPQEPILEKDGTLIVTTEHYKNVGRVLVQYGTNGTLFYQDQEPFKPMIEIDLYSVIKQKYIEREVLDEIRAEIEEQVLESLSDGGDDWFTAEKVNECLDIIDKYKAESEE